MKLIQTLQGQPEKHRQEDTKEEKRYRKGKRKGNERKIRIQEKRTRNEWMAEHAFSRGRDSRSQDPSSLIPNP